MKSPMAGGAKNTLHTQPPLPLPKNKVSEKKNVLTPRGKTCPCLKQLDPTNQIPSRDWTAHLSKKSPPPAACSPRRDRRFLQLTVSPPWSLKEQELAVRLHAASVGVAWSLLRLGSKESHAWLWWGRSLDKKDAKRASIRHGCDSVVSCKVQLGSSTLQVKPQINFFLKKLSQKQGFRKTVSVRHKLILDDL